MARASRRSRATGGDAAPSSPKPVPPPAPASQPDSARQPVEANDGEGKPGKRKAGSPPLSTPAKTANTGHASYDEAADVDAAGAGGGFPAALGGQQSTTLTNLTAGLNFNAPPAGQDEPLPPVPGGEAMDISPVASPQQQQLQGDPNIVIAAPPGSSSDVASINEPPAAAQSESSNDAVAASEHESSANLSSNDQAAEEPEQPQAEPFPAPAPELEVPAQPAAESITSLVLRT